MTPVAIQEHATGCGIASVANICGKSYEQMKQVANAMGIYAEDQSLFSDTLYVRRLLAAEGFECSPDEHSFESWQALPKQALLAIKHHHENGRDFWHWVVFNKEPKPQVLDSAAYLASNIREDFEAMQPKWFIEVWPRKPTRSSQGLSSQGKTSQ